MTAIVNRLNRATRKLPAWPLYILGPVPIVWLYYLGFTGQLGVDPVKAIEHQIGTWALQLLIVGLAITPARRHLGLNLIKYRRAIGLLAFFFVLAHLLTWLVLDIQLLWGQIWADLLKRPYITIGMGGLMLLLPLAVTSNNLSLRRMGAAAWRRLHKLTYGAVLLGALHYVMLVKGWQLTPIIYLLVILALLALRLRMPRVRFARQAG